MLILELLVRSGKMYGLELVAASEGGLKRGTIYVTLQRMEKKGYVASKLEDAPPAVGGLPRRVYTATPQGRELFAVWTAAAARLRVRFAR
jgi:DNA-binding PadR family transcriptional regulator